MKYKNPELKRPENYEEFIIDGTVYQYKAQTDEKAFYQWESIRNIKTNDIYWAERSWGMRKEEDLFLKILQQYNEQRKGN